MDVTNQFDDRVTKVISYTFVAMSQSIAALDQNTSNKGASNYVKLTFVNFL